LADAGLRTAGTRGRRDWLADRCSCSFASRDEGWACVKQREFQHIFAITLGTITTELPRFSPRTIAGGEAGK
jgi:hypothetical protein